MGAQIIFICGFLLLTAGLMCIKKVPERVSFLRSLVICYITELCLGAVLAGVYSVVKLPIGLFSMGIGYLVLALMVWGWIIYRKEIQKFAIYAVDVYFFLVITVFFGILFLKMFTVDVSLIYRNSDPGEHYGLALKVLEKGKVSGMYFAAWYNALVMELFQPFLVRLNLYKAFILADSFSNYINILMFYTLAATFFKSKVVKALSPVICMLYFLGWPFFSYIAGGFVYFGIGVTLFAYVIYLLVVLSKCSKRQDIIAVLLLVALGVFNVAICYMLFVPVLVSCIGVHLWRFCTERKIKLSGKRIVQIVGIIGSLGVIIFCVCYFGFFKGDFSKIFSSLQIEGGIHRELYEDMIFLIPFAIYLGGYYLKKKKSDIIFNTLILISMIAVVAFVFLLAGGMSGYYYYKLYYLLWFFLWLVAVEAVEYFIVEDRLFLWAYAVPFMLAMLITLTGLDDWFASRNLLDENYASIFSVYDVTKSYIREDKDIADKEALISVSQYILDELEDEDVPLITSREKYYLPPWYRDFTGNKSYFANGGKLGNVVNELVEEGYSYILMHQSSISYREDGSILEKYDVIYNDGYYGIYKIK